MTFLASIGGESEGAEEVTDACLPLGMARAPEGFLPSPVRDAVGEIDWESLARSCDTCSLPGIGLFSGSVNWI